MKRPRDAHETVKQYFPFYPAQWLTSRRLRVCSAAARGILADLMAMCWESGGVLRENVATLAKFLHESPKSLDRILRELSEAERITLEIDAGSVSISIPHLIPIYEDAVEHIENQRRAGAKGAQQRYSDPIATLSQPHSDPIAHTGPDRTLPDHKGPDLTGEKKAPGAARPSPAEVTAYSEEIGKPIDGAAFCDFYASKGWKVGGQAMKDWKAAARNWYRRQLAESAGGQHHQHTSSQAARGRTAADYEAVIYGAKEERP